mmetsp:Transcript_7972/g.24507  ORF Transcript_7972/g.24507 Transcript_7972/m.24507 type:complete len:291 (-) Transcript_7972:3907-4779(-)
MRTARCLSSRLPTRAARMRAATRSGPTRRCPITTGARSSRAASSPPPRHGPRGPARHLTSPRPSPRPRPRRRWTYLASRQSLLMNHQTTSAVRRARPRCRRCRAVRGWVRTRMCLAWRATSRKLQRPSQRWMTTATSRASRTPRLAAKRRRRRRRPRMWGRPVPTLPTQTTRSARTRMTTAAASAGRASRRPRRGPAPRRLRPRRSPRRPRMFRCPRKRSPAVPSCRSSSAASAATASRRRVWCWRSSRSSAAPVPAICPATFARATLGRTCPASCYRAARRPHARPACA